MTVPEHQKIIEECWENSAQPISEETRNSIRWAANALDKGEIRVAEPAGDDWVVNEWIKKAVLLFFRISPLRKMAWGDFEFFDKIDLKKNYETLGLRVVPHAMIRYGAFVSPGVVLMPSYVNIGARIGSGSLIDTWATVGSCAQIGQGVHLSGGVGIGGVLEPIQGSPVIIEDHAFVGSRCVVVEGVRVGREAVLAANVILTSSSRIIDVTGKEPKTHRGWVPPRSVVIPGSFEKQFPAGKYQVPCSLIIGKRTESTSKKTSLNAVLREHELAV